MEATSTQGTRHRGRKSAKRFDVTGFIAFETVNIGDTFDPVMLRTAILMADSAYPWNADNARLDQDTDRAALDLSEPVVINSGFGTLYVISLRHDMRFSVGQIGAYETYLRTLAEAIAKAGLPLVDRVYSRLHVRTPFDGFVSGTGAAITGDEPGDRAETYAITVTLT